MKNSRRTISWSRECEERKLSSATCLQRACHLLNHKLPYFQCSALQGANQKDRQTVCSSAGITCSPTQTKLTSCHPKILSQPLYLEAPRLSQSAGNQPRTNLSGVQGIILNCYLDKGFNLIWHTCTFHLLSHRVYKFLVDKTILFQSSQDFVHSRHTHKISVDRVSLQRC